VPSIATSDTIYIYYYLDVNLNSAFQTINTTIGFNYLGKYYQIGYALFNITGPVGGRFAFTYTAAIPVQGLTFIDGFPPQVIPNESTIVLTTSLASFANPTNRVFLEGGLGGTKIIFY